MRTCTRHTGAVVVFVDSRDPNCSTFCPVCKAHRRMENTNAETFNELDALRQKLREAENTAGAIDGRGLENRIRALKMEIAVLRKKLREAEDDVARSHADRRWVSDVNDGFVECAACKGKLVILCDSCCRNRERISGLVQWQNEVREFWERYN